MIGWNLVLLTHKQEKHFFKDTYSCNLHTHTSTWIYLTNQNHETNELTDYTGTYNNIYRPVYGTVCTGIQLHISYPAPIRINLVIKLYIFRRTKNEKKIKGWYQIHIEQLHARILYCRSTSPALRFLQIIHKSCIS